VESAIRTLWERFVLVNTIESKMNNKMKRFVLPSGIALFAIVFASVAKLDAQPAKRIEHTKDSLDVVKARLTKGTAVLVDVREPFEWNDRHLKAATLMPLSDLREAKGDADFAKKLAKKLPHNKVIYLHCRSGGRVLAATPILRAMNFDVRPLKAGYSVLVKAGFEKAK
jgi:rhodanese-related sulfurtransferase